MNPAPQTRMGADERRDLVLAAATRAFARSGYAGTSTDAVAKEAGVSQPYVVRIFGSKLDLFLEVFTRATGRIGDGVRGRAGRGGLRPDVARRTATGWASAYTELLADRDFLLVMMHGFTASRHPGDRGRGARGHGPTSSRSCAAAAAPTRRSATSSPRGCCST